MGIKMIKCTKLTKCIKYVRAHRPYLFYRSVYVCHVVSRRVYVGYVHLITFIFFIHYIHYKRFLNTNVYWLWILKYLIVRRAISTSRAGISKSPFPSPNHRDRTNPHPTTNLPKKRSRYKFETHSGKYLEHTKKIGCFTMCHSRKGFL